MMADRQGKCACVCSDLGSRMHTNYITIHPVNTDLPHQSSKLLVFSFTDFQWNKYAASLSRFSTSSPCIHIIGRSKKACIKGKGAEKQAKTDLLKLNHTHTHTIQRTAVLFHLFFIRHMHAYM
jgi:hypothetical protein